MKNPVQSGQLRKIQHHDKTINNFSENNCLFVAGICIFLDSVRHIHHLGVYDK